MTTNELREAFQRFYEERGHLRVPPHSLIPPPDDQTTLFIVAGMQQFKPYFLRTKEPPSDRVVSVQKCLRAGGKDTDLEDVGRTDRHNSFFEMMGNFSFGDYFKDEAVDFAWEFVTTVLKIDTERLWVTVHEGNPVYELDEDTVAIEAWLRVGVPAARIVRLGEDNFWQAADTGPCGPCTEIFYDRGEEHACGDPACRPGHCDRYYEFYNLVFIQYDLQPGNRLVPLPNANVDTGMGVERTACVLQDVGSNYDTDGFRVIMDWIERESGVGYHDSPVATKAQRVIADHARAVSFLIAEGIVPSNEGRGYICRRLLRRAIQHANRIGLQDLSRLPAVVIEQMGEAYPELQEHAGEIERVVRAEEERFSETLARGLKVFDELAGSDAITAEDAFTLVATLGFPIELTQELAEERGQAVDVDGFHALMAQHREISRAGGESTTLQAAAQLVGGGARESEFVGYSKTKVLSAVAAAAPAEGERQFVKLEQSPFYAASGGQVSDKGTIAVDGEEQRLEEVDVLKFGADQVLVVDLAGHEPLAVGTRVEAAVNWSDRFPTQANHTATHLLHQALRDVLGDHVQQAGSAVRPDKLRFDFTHEKQLTPDEKERVERIVNEKVFEAISVRTFVTPIDEARKLGAMMLFGEKYGEEVRVVEIGDYSTELCGGTHVRSTAEIGPFAITSEGSVGSGARRIEAVTAGEAWTLLEGYKKELEALRGELEQVRRESKKTKAQAAGPDIVWQDKQGKVFVAEVTGVRGSAALRDFSDQLRQREDASAVVLASADDGKVALVVNLDNSLAGLDAVAIVRELGPIIGGGGGGRPTLAEAGGKNVGAVRDALAAGRDKLAAAVN
ncbi:MAG: alanyl-tRNA synthetase [Gaiellaceae bacterium]|nr:alanyl-tRNA synthetase [Gaiellaceae bacterium]